MKKNRSNFFKRLFLRLYITLHTWSIRIGSAFANTESEMFGAIEISERGSQNQRIRHRNPIAEKMLQGQKDEKFVQDYYEVLKKADAFIRNSTPEKVEMAADKHGVVAYGKKDKWGRRHAHYGFYDPKHKNYGKTMNEAMKGEVIDRSTKDDDYEVEFMFKNEPAHKGFVGNDQIIETENGFESVNEYEKSKLKKFPMKITRKKDAVNKIEQLTEFLHIKKVSSEHRLLEFFIPTKFKLLDQDEDGDVFKEIVDIDQVWINDEYGEPYGYSIKEYYKRIEYTDEHNEDDVVYHVIKLKGHKIEKIN